MQCAALCNEYGETFYERTFDFAADVTTKAPDVMMALRENVRTHYRKGMGLVRNGARQAENSLRQNWNEVRGAGYRSAYYAKRRADQKYKAFGDYVQGQRQYLDEVVFSRRNMTGLASAGALSVLSVALYKHGLPVDGGSRTENGIYGFYPQDVVLQQHSGTFSQDNDSGRGRSTVSYQIVEIVPPAEETLTTDNEAGDVRTGQDVLAFSDRLEQERQEPSQNPQNRERPEIHDLVTAIPLADSFRVSSGYGLRYHPVTGQHNKMHQGVDIASPPNTPVEAPADGVVKFAGWKQGYGKVVIIDHENGVDTLYAHLNSFGVRRGDRVKKGEAFAKVGATGRVTGPHLHFEIHENGRHVNPRQYVRSQRSVLQSRFQP